MTTPTIAEVEALAVHCAEKATNVRNRFTADAKLLKEAAAMLRTLSAQVESSDKVGKAAGKVIQECYQTEAKLKSELTAANARVAELENKLLNAAHNSEHLRERLAEIEKAQPVAYLYNLPGDKDDDKGRLTFDRLYPDHCKRLVPLYDRPQIQQSIKVATEAMVVAGCNGFVIAHVIEAMLAAAPKSEEAK